jgi:Right handed beta helix region/Chondroitinase B
MLIIRILLISMLLAVVSTIYATEYHVAVTGKDNNPGTLEKPLRTIQAAVSKMQAGDTVLIHQGTYREAVSIEKSGTASAPIVIMAAKNEKAVISGLDLLNLKWKFTDKKGIFVAEFNGPAFEQMFCNGKPLLEARWPNVPRDKNGDWNFFSPDAWATVDTAGNSYGTVKDADLAATGWNVTGATAVLNVGHQFFVWSRVVENHSAGSSSFNYPKDLGKSIKPADESGASLIFNDDRYYLVGKKEFLDVPGEWFYDSNTKQLFVYSPDGKSPEKHLLEIKIRNYSLTASSSSNYITFDGLTFFGTAFSFGKDYNSRSNNIVFKNNSVLFSSWTEHFSMPKDDVNEKCDKNYPMINADNSQVINNIFAYGAMSALYISGLSNLIENNLIHDFDLNSSLMFPPLQVSKPWEALVGKSARATIRYNTIYNSGGISMQVAQADNDVYMNDMYDFFRACWGGNKDVSALYAQNIFCHGTRLHHNWVHEGYAGTPPHPWGGGMGIRGDDQTTGLTVDHNVVWNIGSTGLELKNPINTKPEQANGVYNNTIFQHSKYNKVQSAMIVETIARQSKYGDSNEKVLLYSNAYSSIVNNLAETIYGHWFAAPLQKIADYSHNATGEVVESHLENPINFDFRPKANATDVIDKGVALVGITDRKFGPDYDIGAYERGDSVYWIPGRREAKASFPIVPDSASTSSDRDILMWRPAYKAFAHKLFFGKDANTLRLAGNFRGENNVFVLPKLDVGQKYYWRVDAVMVDNSIKKGDVWYFNTK